MYCSWILWFRWLLGMRVWCFNENLAGMDVVGVVLFFFSLIGASLCLFWKMLWFQDESNAEYGNTLEWKANELMVYIGKWDMETHSELGLWHLTGDSGFLSLSLWRQSDFESKLHMIVPAIPAMHSDGLFLVVLLVSSFSSHALRALFTNPH